MFVLTRVSPAKLYARIEEANASTHLMAEIAKEAHTVTEIANTNLHSMEDINEAAEQLAKNAENLHSLIYQFKY
ncbi:hypothetical protein ACIQZG_07645 [Lysinibacillus sp. NPDC096418]|uniref:hypothetical protein n=1 Tax=Lysinibacillus sp. NPDC096418 TaxID=3364138 RepID=UPI0038267DD6